MSSSWLADCISRHFPGGTAPDPVLLRESLEGRLTDTRKLRGKRHPLPSLVSVMIGGAAAGHGGPLAVAQAAAGWDQDVLGRARLPGQRADRAAGPAVRFHAGPAPPVPGRG